MERDMYDSLMPNRTMQSMQWELMLAYIKDGYTFRSAMDEARKGVDAFCEEQCLFIYNPITDEEAAA